MGLKNTTQVGVIRGQRLLPCPFCGNDKHFRVDGPNCEGLDGMCVVRCECCISDGPRGRYKTKAIKLWNRRPRLKTQ